jgi:hypothetical protein
MTQIFTPTELLPCPFCGDPMQDRSGILQHVDQGTCPIGAQGWPIEWTERWTTRQSPTSPEHGELIERLRKQVPKRLETFTGPLNANVYVNPDGPEATRVIEAQAAALTEHEGLVRENEVLDTARRDMVAVAGKLGAKLQALEGLARELVERLTEARAAIAYVDDGALGYSRSPMGVPKKALILTAVDATLTKASALVQEELPDAR